MLFNEDNARGNAKLSNLTMRELYTIMYDRIDNIRPPVQADIHAICQQACVLIEKKMGTYPATGKLAGTNVDNPLNQV